MDPNRIGAPEARIIERALARGYLSQADVDKALAKRDAERAGGRACELLPILAAGSLDPSCLPELRRLHAQVLAESTESATETGEPSRYVIQRELGRGGMGAVYLGLDRDLDRSVAIKRLLWSASSAVNVERFQREAKAVARLQHEHIVQVYDIQEEGGEYYMVMELIEGESLQDRIEREKQLPERDVALLGVKLAQALDYAHGLRILHRDVKPHNVLLTKDGEPKLSDFGLAKVADLRAVTESSVEAVSLSAEEFQGGTRSLTLAGEIVGTPAYMSPEQAQGKAVVVDARTDTYALGATLYAALTGRPPFIGSTLFSLLNALLCRHPDPIRELRADVSPELEAIVMRCLEKEPGDRYPSARAVALELSGWLRVQSARVPAASEVPGAPRGVRKQGLVAAIALAGALVALLVVWFAASWTRSRARDSLAVVGDASSSPDPQGASQTLETTASPTPEATATPETTASPTPEVTATPETTASPTPEVTATPAADDTPTDVGATPSPTPAEPAPEWYVVPGVGFDLLSLARPETWDTTRTALTAWLLQMAQADPTVEALEALRTSLVEAKSASPAGEILLDFALGVTLVAAGAPGEALPLLAGVTQTAPTLPWAWVELGHAQRLSGASADALASYRQALELEPKHPGARYALTLIRGAEGHTEEALSEARAGLAEAAARERALESSEPLQRAEGYPLRSWTAARLAWARRLRTWLAATVFYLERLREAQDPAQASEANRPYRFYASDPQLIEVARIALGDRLEDYTTLAGKVSGSLPVVVMTEAELARAGHTVGYPLASFDPHSNVLLLVFDTQRLRRSGGLRDEREERAALIRHLGWHQALSAAHATPAPPWLDEGLALLFQVNDSVNRGGEAITSFSTIFNVARRRVVEREAPLPLELNRWGFDIPSPHRLPCRQTWRPWPTPRLEATDARDADVFGFAHYLRFSAGSLLRKLLKRLRRRVDPAKLCEQLFPPKDRDRLLEAWRSHWRETRESQ